MTIFTQIKFLQKKLKKKFVIEKNMEHAKREKNMEHAKVQKDKKPVKPVYPDDCSCTSTDQLSSSDCTPKYDKYDEHCEVKHREGKTNCMRKCRTVCVVECKKEVNYQYEWCYKTKEDQKWKPIQSEKIPKKCEDKKPDNYKPDNKKY